MKKIVKTLILLGCLGILYQVTFGFPSIYYKKGAEKQNLAKLAVAPLDKSSSNGNFAELKAGSTLPKFPNKIMVYKVKPPQIDEKQVINKAKMLGISGSIEKHEYDFSISSESGDFIIDKNTGSFTYITKELETQVLPIKKLLSDRQYKKIATDFLAKNSLLHNNAVFADVNRDNIYTDGTGLSGPYMVEVRFRSKKLNGIEFGGVGPKIIVQFGENGKVIGAFSVWREIEPFMEYPILTPDEAIEITRQGRAIVYNSEINDSGIVNEASVLYDNEPLGYDQEFVIPYYKLKGKNSKGKDFIALVRAVPENLISEKRYKLINVPPEPPSERPIEEEEGIVEGQ